jgi:hypothetical protein
VLFEVVEDGVLPSSVVDQRDLLVALGRDYKRINAPVGELGLVSLAASTAGLASPDAALLARVNAALDDVAARRTDIAGRMLMRLEAAAFDGQRLDPTETAGLQAEALALLDSARALPVE